MGLFDDSGKSDKAVRAAVSTTIANGSTVTGDLSGDGDVVLDGLVVGNICCHRLTVGADGELQGEADVEELIVRGVVKGTVRARAASFTATARVYGDVEHDVLEVEAGAEIVGRYRRTKTATDGIERPADKAKVTARSGSMQREAPPQMPKRQNPASAPGAVREFPDTTGATQH